MKAKRRINKRKFISRLVCLLAVVVLLNAVVSFAKYPEQYLTTWKCQLENDLAKGNRDAIEYYNDTYVANGKYLFGGKYIVEERKDEYLNMATVVGYEMSDEGVMLITDDGNGYFIEK